MAQPLVIPADTTVDELADILRAQGDHELFVCRDIGHGWTHHDGQVLGRRLYERTMRCTRCGTRRVQQLNHVGEILGSWYEYPDHYLIKGMGRLTTKQRSAFRQVTLLDVLVEQGLMASGNGKGA
jgi:hypothetical protein